MARPREFDEQAVLRAAQDVFRRRGYGGATVSDLTEATGLGKSSLYGAYGSKHGLYLAALDEYRDRNVEAVRRDLDRDGTAMTNLRSVLLEVARASTGPSPSCLLNGAATELSDHDAVVAGRVTSAFCELGTVLAEAVRAAQDQGDIDPGADADEVADALLAIGRGIDVLGHGGMPRERLERAADAALTAFATRASGTVGFATRD
jgi:TetR/AcrR family transcriptional regulator, transcriptional repressor for nem operon